MSLKNVTKIYLGNVNAVSSVNLDILDRGFIILVRTSVCDKTTTLQMITALEKITQDEIYLNDKLINNLPPKARVIAMVFQNYALYPHMSVYNNIAFLLHMAKQPKKEVKNLTYITKD